MQTICLVKEQVLCFTAEHKAKEELFLERQSSTDLRAELPPPFFATGVGTQHKWNRHLEVKIMLSEFLPCQEGAIGSMQLEADQQNHVLGHILEWDPLGKLTLTLEVSNFGYQVGPENCHLTSWTVEGIDINKTRRLKILSSGKLSYPPSFLCVKNFQNKISASMIAAWKNNVEFTGTFSVYLSAIMTPLSYELAIRRQHWSNCRKMFEESVGTDIELLTRENGITIKCHTGMLSVCSGILRRLLKMQKGRKQVDFMRHLSSDIVRKLLAYVYHADVKFVGTSVSFALELLEASTKFQLFGLVLHIQIYLAEKMPNEYSASEAVKLFVIAKSDLEDSGFEESDESEVDDDSNSDNHKRTDGIDHEEYEVADEHKNTNDDNDRNAVVQTRVGLKRIYENDYSQRKRNCVAYKGTRNPVYGDNIDGCSRTSTVTNVSGIGSNESDNAPQNSGTAVFTKFTDGITFDDVSLHRGTLEIHAVKIILWQRKNNPTGLLGCTEYIDLVKTPHLLMDITNIFLMSDE